MILGISGRKQVGKSTAARYLVREYGFVELSFAEPIRRFACEILGIDLDRLERTKEDVVPWIGKSPRQIMQTLGTEWGRQMINPDLWVRSVIERAKKVPLVVISDVRFWNEAASIRDCGGMVIRLTRGLRPQPEHASEIDIADNLISCEISNDSDFAALYGRIDLFMRMANIPKTNLSASAALQDFCMSDGCPEPKSLEESAA